MRERVCALDLYQGPAGTSGMWGKPFFCVGWKNMEKESSMYVAIKGVCSTTVCEGYECSYYFWEKCWEIMM
jgi:hypothetical protein